MKVAFYSPIKPPGHPVPSGDRLMARLLIQALELGGADVEVVSEFRSFRKAPPVDGLVELRAQAETELARIAAGWRRDGVPDLFFAYHPYYKAPDLVGPELSRKFAIPYVTVEASYSRRRNESGWRDMQAFVAGAVEAATINFSMTERDREGLLANFPAARTAILPPFLDAAPYLAHRPEPERGWLVTVAMMRPGDKLDSYSMLAAALADVKEAAWSLSVVGDGPARPEIEGLFASLPSERIVWHGQLGQGEIARLLARSSIYLWPGVGEAYGLAYLEAEAAGLPVIAQEIAGVPSVVIHGRTGILTPAGDVAAYAGAIRRLLSDEQERSRLARGARDFVRDERSLEAGSQRLMSLIHEFTGLT
jgi:glycosyltransferase involved in cell wall biosynthesis